MRRVRAWLVRLGGLFHNERRDRELAEELESHLRLHIEDNLRSGMTAETARRNALIKLGGVESTKEAFRDQRGLPGLESVVKDFYFGLRVLRKNPGFTGISVLSLAMGIAVNVAVFSCLNALLFRPPPGVKDPERLVYLHEMSGGVPCAEFEFLRDHTAVFSELAASVQCRSGVRLDYRPTRRPADGAASGETEYPTVRFVSANYFSLIGTEFKLGRGFLPEEDRKPGSHPVVILSHLFWKRLFNSTPDLIGQTVKLNNRACTVIGIAPEKCPREPGVFVPPDVWVPFMMQAELDPVQIGLQPGNGDSRGIQFYY